jgi:hypothetical protein
MKAFLLSMSVLVGLSLGNSALAQCCAKSKAAHEGAMAKTAGETSACHGKAMCAKGAVATDMPKMLYKVGDETTCCPKQADKLAGGDSSKIRYVVAGKEYTKNEEALKAYATVLDEYLNSMQNVRFVVGEQCVSCPMAAQALAKGAGQPMKYRVAAITFAEKAKAETAAKLARAAAEKVQMTCVVDGQKYSCPKEAEQACAKSGKKAEYVVGDMKTNCPITAGVELAKARIDAARKALEEYVRT